MQLLLKETSRRKCFTRRRGWTWSNIIFFIVRFIIYFRGNIKYPFGISSIKRKSIKAFNNDNYTNSLYLRFEVKDKQGVLSLITNRLAKYKISVKRIIQTPDKKNNKATIVIITHKTTEINVKNCLSIFKKIKIFLNSQLLIRLYN